jgi:hypothetical protein
VLVAIFVGVAVHLIGYVLLRRLPKDVHERALNELLGLVPGLANGLITAAIVSALLLSIPLNEGLRESAAVNRLAGYAERLETALHPVFGDAIAETLNLLTVRPESHAHRAMSAVENLGIYAVDLAHALRKNGCVGSQDLTAPPRNPLRQRRGLAGPEPDALLPNHH